MYIYIYTYVIFILLKLGVSSVPIGSHVKSWIQCHPCRFVQDIERLFKGPVPVPTGSRSVGGASQFVARLVEPRHSQ